MLPRRHKKSELHNLARPNQLSSAQPNSTWHNPAQALLSTSEPTPQIGAVGSLILEGVEDEKSLNERLTATQRGFQTGAAKRHQALCRAVVGKKGMLSEEEADLALGDVARGLKADHERNLDTLSEALRRERDRQRARILEQSNRNDSEALGQLVLDAQAAKHVLLHLCAHSN